MPQLIQVKIPDIGDYSNVDVIEISVQVGDKVQPDDTLVTLETEKATMDVPAENSGIIKEIKIKVGDKVSEGDVIVVIETEIKTNSIDNQVKEKNEITFKEPISSPARTTIFVPDIGDYTGVDVIEVSIKMGDTVSHDQTLIVLETEKATMDVPATTSGIVTQIFVQVGDKVSQNDPIIEIQPSEDQSTVLLKNIVSEVSNQATEAPKQVNPVINKPCNSIQSAYGDQPVSETDLQKAYAGPAVRKLARELGVNLLSVYGTGNRGRIVADDVKNYVKETLTHNKQSSDGNTSFNFEPLPKIDFSKYGKIETVEISRIKKISGKNLARNWVMIPHVTQHDEADMTELESFRKSLNAEWQKESIKFSPLVFIIKAIVAGLKKFPHFNASLDGDHLILKKYYHIGFAADTPNGLVVPVIKDIDQKGLKDISIELKELSQKAREGKLKPQEMQGASFTVSSLGGIGGTYFSPIINAPEVAILGIGQSQIKPIWNGHDFEPRLMCPLSLSYDHRVIDGADACRFTNYLSDILADFRRTTL